MKVFQTTNFDEVARKIIIKGEIHLTADQRKQMVEEKRRTGHHVHILERDQPAGWPSPSPRPRIERAMEEAPGLTSILQACR